MKKFRMLREESTSSDAGEEGDEKLEIFIQDLSIAVYMILTYINIYRDLTIFRVAHWTRYVGMSEAESQPLQSERPMLPKAEVYDRAEHLYDAARSS